MDSVRFDSIAKLFASRKSRRAAVGGGLGLAATAVAGRALAQDATPVASPDAVAIDPHPSANGSGTNPEFLFVQPFDGGTWAPKDGADGAYTLTLTGAAANTIYFSDRPERIVGLTETQLFLETLGFSPTNPPNAALVAHDETGEQDILVIELLNPVYAPDTQTLTYDATVLADYGEDNLAHLARQQQDYELPESFGAGSLFIDDLDCDDTIYIDCVSTDTGRLIGSYVGELCVDMDGGCVRCNDPVDMCGQKFSECWECSSTGTGECENVNICTWAEGDN